MNSKITKLATAAVIIIGVGMTVHLADKATTPAWAIEQSIDAMKNYRGLHLTGTVSVTWQEAFKNFGVENFPESQESNGDFEMWAHADETLSKSAETKIICSDATMFGKNFQNYIQLDNGVTYGIQGQHFKIDPWFTSELLKTLKEQTDNWTELKGRDAETGKEQIFVKCSSREKNKSWELVFDAETKLLVSIKQWDNSKNQKGIPTFDIWKIVYYEDLPDEIFEIDLPEPDKIIYVNTPINDPNYGMNAEGLTEEQACRKILEEFWQAALEQDFGKVRKLCPFTVNMCEDDLKNNLGINEGLSGLVEIGELQYGDSGTIAPCIVQLESNKMLVNMVVMFREISGEKSCIILKNEGKAVPVE